jgi:hypothetical protein
MWWAPVKRACSFEQFLLVGLSAANRPVHPRSVERPQQMPRANDPLTPCRSSLQPLRTPVAQ